jgi:hypothetical protein
VFSAPSWRSRGAGDPARIVHAGAHTTLFYGKLFLMRITARAAFSFLLVLSGGPLCAACANSDGAGDLASADGGEAGTPSTGPSGTSGTSGTRGTSDGGNDAGSGAGDASPDAAPHSEGGSGPVVRCGFSATCPLPGQICCVAQATVYTCVTATTCPSMTPSSPAPASGALACSGTESCGPGLSCCLDVVAGQTVSSCQASCAAAHAQLCAPFTADPGCPGGGLTCSQSHINEFGLSTAYGTCGGVKN